MNKAHSLKNWENYPSINTPLNAQNLNEIDGSVDVIDDRVITLDTTKFNKTEAQRLFKDVSLDRSTGIITFTMVSGATKTIDTLLEKIAVNFDYDAITQRLIITLDDGTVKYIDLSALITQYEFWDSETVAFSIGSDGKVSAIVKEGSIEEKHLRPDYLADIKVEVAKAQSSQQAAAVSEANAKDSENAAKASQEAAKNSENNAKKSEENAAKSEIMASISEEEARIEADKAKNVAEGVEAARHDAEMFARDASNSAEYSAQKASESAESAENAANSAANALQKSTEASNSATKAESFARGGTGTRENEDIDNAKYYYNQSKSISESFSGALRPMGTVTFESLPPIENATAGDMYNVSDEFITTSDFKEGAGSVIPAGANVYKTSDGYWDVLAGTPVTSVNGQSGNVSITAENIKALPINGGTVEGVTRFNHGLIAKNRVYGYDDDEGIIVERAENGYATLTLGDFSGIRTAFSLYPNNTAAWRHNGTSFSEIFHPGKTGTIALTSDIGQDGNGNNIADTYAKRSVYGDSEVSYGRRSDSVIGQYSFAFGEELEASGKCSHAEGRFSKATGKCSHAEGSDGRAYGDFSHAEGGLADGYHSHAEGSGRACGEYSHAEGVGTEASNYASHASGRNNKIMNSGGDYYTQIGDIFVVGNGIAAGTNPSKSNAFRITYAGDIYGTRAFQSSGADYAEFIVPWADGNEENEDRVGYFVTIRDGFLHKAEPGDYIAGITSGNPSIVGNADEDYYWRYERDAFNRIVMEDVPETVQKLDEDEKPIRDENGKPIYEETGKMIPNARMKLAEGYDPSLQEGYVERKNRKEWDYVGMMGVLPVRDDGTCVPGRFCKCGEGGIATLAEERGFDTYMVLERINETVVSVILK